MAGAAVAVAIVVALAVASAARMRRISVINLHVVQCNHSERSLHVLAHLYAQCTLHTHTNIRIISMSDLFVHSSFFISFAQDGHDEDVFIEVKKKREKCHRVITLIYLIPCVQVHDDGGDCEGTVHAFVYSFFPLFSLHVIDFYPLCRIHLRPSLLAVSFRRAIAFSFAFLLHAQHALHDSQLLHIFLILISGWYVNCVCAVCTPAPLLPFCLHSFSLTWSLCISLLLSLSLSLPFNHTVDFPSLSPRLWTLELIKL